MLAGGEVAAIAVLRAPGGALAKVQVTPPPTTTAFFAVANRACAVEAHAAAGLARLPSLQQSARLIAIERRVEAALVPVAGAPAAGPQGLAVSPAWFLIDLLNYEQHLNDFHRHVAEGAPQSLTQSDLTATRGAQRGLTQAAGQLELKCDFRTALATPPDPKHSSWQALPPRRRAPHVDESPAANPGFTPAKARAILAANPNNADIQCGPGSNGWTYICTYLNGGQLHRAGLLARDTSGQPFITDIPSQGPVPGPNS